MQVATAADADVTRYSLGWPYLDATPSDPASQCKVQSTATRRLERNRDDEEQNKTIMPMRTISAHRHWYDLRTSICGN